MADDQETISHSLEAAVAHLEAFAAAGAADREAWARPRGGNAELLPDGQRVVTMPWIQYGPSLDAIWATFDLAGIGPRPIDYLAWADGFGSPITPDAIATMTRDDLTALVTMTSRGERFCTGYWQGALDDGTFLAIARRALDLSERE